jgi:hypothetical protein
MWGPNPPHIFALERLSTLKDTSVTLDRDAARLYL